MAYSEKRRKPTLVDEAVSAQVKALDNAKTIYGGQTPPSYERFDGPTRCREIWEVMPHELPIILDAILSAKLNTAVDIPFEYMRELATEYFVGVSVIRRLEVVVDRYQLKHEKRVGARQ